MLERAERLFRKPSALPGGVLPFPGLILAAWRGCSLPGGESQRGDVPAWISPTIRQRPAQAPSGVVVAGLRNRLGLPNVTVKGGAPLTKIGKID